MAAALSGLRLAYRLRWKRRKLLWRAFRKRHELRAVADRTGAIRPDTILCFSTVRNEAARLPWFLEHHRRLGVGHFLFVDNGSDDGSAAWLSAQPDVSLWSTGAGYKAARFGADWLTWLQMRYGHGRWCLTLDADEVLIYPYWETRDLRALTEWLVASGRAALPAMMLDLYPRGRLGEQAYLPGQDPTEVVGWFDAGNLTITRQPELWNLWIQGGVRSRAFLEASPRQGPTLSKTPLILWNRRYAYVNSTHSILPRRLNRVYATDGGEAPSGILLHTKFLPTIVARSREERDRAEHFHDATLYERYYAGVIDAPDLWCPQSRPYRGWRELEALGLMSRGGWI